MSSIPSPFSVSPVELKSSPQPLTKRPVWNYFFVSMMAGLLAGYVYHIGSELSFPYQVQTWYVPVISALVITWVPWVVSKMCRVDTLEKLGGLCMLMAFIGWDMMTRVAYTFYQVGMWGC